MLAVAIAAYTATAACDTAIPTASTTAFGTLVLDGSDWELTHFLNGVASTVIENATVPGGVWDNMERADKVGNPLYRDNAIKYANITNFGTYTFRKSFMLPIGFAAEAGAVVQLECDGIQTLANVSLNGQRVLSTNNMFRQFSAVLPQVAFHRGEANVVEITLQSTPAPASQKRLPVGMDEVGLRDESDAWGWDWSPSLNPISIYKSIRLVSVAPTLPYVVSFSPVVSVETEDPVSGRPHSFVVNVSVEFMAAPHTETLKGTLHLFGDWRGAAGATVIVSHPPSSTAHTISASVHCTVATDEVELWWPLHYGTPALHTLVVNVTWEGSAMHSLSAHVGFRSVALHTGPAVPERPSDTDPLYRAAFVGCFRDGNIYWGGPQHALPHLAADEPNMTVGRCLDLCAALKGNITLAGLQRGTRCYCGSSIGSQTPECLPGVGTETDISECVWPCGGNPEVACGGGSYMWGTNSVYNVTTALRARAAGVTTFSSVGAIPPPPPLSDEGSGNSAFAVMVNGVKVFARGANLVPFELLEATVRPEYIAQTVESVRDGNMNMIRVWGGGMYQDTAFYEACDRLGILVFQDMMFSERLYPHAEEFRANVAAEVQYQVHRLRRHPSIALWDSSNENDGDPVFFYDTVLTSVADADSSRPLWPSSPSSGFATGVDTATGRPNGRTLTGRFQVELDTHQPYNFCSSKYVASTQMNLSTYFKSEFGQVALPAWETIGPMLAPEDLSVLSPVMLGRKHAGEDLIRSVSGLFKFSDFNTTTEAAFRRMIFLTQLAQTLCIKTVVEELRRGEETFGALIWQLNDVWQASSWGSLDYGGRWRALHHGFQALFAPTVASLWIDGNSLAFHVSHHGTVMQNPPLLQVAVLSVHTGDIIHHSLHELPRLANRTAAVIPVTTLLLDSIDSATQVIMTTLVQPGEVPVNPGLDFDQTVHLLLPPRNMSWIAVSRDDVVIATAEVTTSGRDGASPSGITVDIHNKAAAPVVYAVVSSTCPGRFERNLLWIHPSSSHTLTFLSHGTPTKACAEASSFKASLSLDWLNTP